MNAPLEQPKDGGSYRRLADGSLQLLEATTGERACKCRPDELHNDDPNAAPATVIEHVDELEIHGLVETTAQPGEALHPIESNRRAGKRK